MITPAAGPPSHRWSSKPGTGPGPQGHPEERRQKTKARYQSPSSERHFPLKKEKKDKNILMICCFIHRNDLFYSHL